MRRAASSGMTPDQFAQAVVEGGQVPMLVGEVARGKALAVVVEAAKVNDTNGEVVDLEDDEDEDEAAAETRRGRRGAPPRPTDETPRPSKTRGLSPRGAADTTRTTGPGRHRVRARRAHPRAAHRPEPVRGPCGTLRSQRTVRRSGMARPTCALGSMIRGQGVPEAGGPRPGRRR